MQTYHIISRVLRTRAARKSWRTCYA